MTTYFYDSYAIIAYIEGQKKMKPYFEKHTGITTLYNAMEVYYWCIRIEGSEVADKVLRLLEEWLFTPQTIDVPVAIAHYHKHRMKKLSYVDSLGYTLAQKHGCKFLTGDKEFKDMSNVEFVKV